METPDNIFLLEGKVQHYAWGGYEFIPSLLKMENKRQLTFAEYWLGAHDSNASDVIINEHFKVPLNAFIEKNTDRVLGKSAAEKFQKLPFLFKILDIREMLSIQVHPDKKSAEIEFEKENEAGIPIHSPQRNYRDDNHKLELAVAIDELWLLHGFKPAEKLIEILTAVPEFNSFIHIYNVSGNEGLYRHVMELAQPSVNAILQTLVSRVEALYEKGLLNKSHEDYWAAKAALSYSNDGNIDRGIFSIYFLNLFFLNKGEAVYQDAGILHAYLEGRIVELMSNSDNVLRGGLTVKHIDIDALMKLVDFRETNPDILNPVEQGDCIFVYETESPDFLLKKYSLNAGQQINIQSDAIEVLFVLEGQVMVQNEKKKLALTAGQSAFVLANQTFFIQSNTSATIFSSTIAANITE